MRTAVAVDRAAAIAAAEKVHGTRTPAERAALEAWRLAVTEPGAVLYATAGVLVDGHTRWTASLRALPSTNPDAPETPPRVEAVPVGTRVQCAGAVVGPGGVREVLARIVNQTPCAAVVLPQVGLWECYPHPACWSLESERSV